MTKKTKKKRVCNCDDTNSDSQIEELLDNQFDYDYNYAIELSQAVFLSEYNSKYKIPKKYRINCEIIGITNYYDFEQLIIEPTNKFDKFIFKTIINSIKRQNEHNSCKIFRIDSNDSMCALFYSMKSALENDYFYYERAIDNPKFKDIIIEYSKINNIHAQKLVILSESFMYSLFFFYKMISRIECEELLLKINSFID